MASEALINNATVIFNKQFDEEIAGTKEQIAKNEAKVKEHQEVHAQILKYLESNKLISKEAFLKIFPVEGGRNTTTSIGSGIPNPDYTTLLNGFRDEADKDLKKLPDRLYKLANAHSRLASSKIQLQNEEKLKKDGVEGLIGLLYSAVIKQTNGSALLAEALGTKEKPTEYNAESWKDTVSAITNDFNIFAYIPSGILSDASLFNLIQEKYFSGELGQKSDGKIGAEAKASPINATEAGGEKTKTASPINQPTGEGSGKKETSASITETGEVKKEPEPKSNVVSKTESINESKSESKPEGETAKKETAPGKTPVEEKKATAGTINIGEKELAELDKREKEEKQKQAKISNVVQNLKITDETKKSNVTDILTRFSESRGKELAETPKGSLNESFEKGKELAQSLGKIGAPSTAVNETNTTNQASTTSSTTANFENTQSASTSQTINQTDQSKTTTSSAPVTNTSSKKTLTEAQQNIINDYKQKMGILTPEEKKIRAELEQSVKIESGSAVPIKAGETVVEKGKTAFNEKVSANPQNTFISTQNTQNPSKTIPQSEKTIEVTKKEIAAAPAKTVAEPSPAAQQSAPMDFSRLEKILRNLEEILNSPLSVKVIG